MFIDFLGTYGRHRMVIRFSVLCHLHGAALHWVASGGKLCFVLRDSRGLYGTAHVQSKRTDFSSNYPHPRFRFRRSLAPLGAN